MSCPSISEILQEIRSCHAKAVSYFSDAVAKDEAGNQAESVGFYLNALRYSEEGLFYNVHDLDPSGRQWEETREMQERMIITQGKVKERIYELQCAGHRNDAHGASPPAYSLNDPLKAEEMTPSAPQPTDLWAETLLSISSGVQMYFVSSDNQVGAPPPSYPTSLKILRLNELQRSPSDPEAILQIGDKAYPLLRNQMPILKSLNGVYMFPNCNEDGIQEGSLGIVVPKSVPRIEVRRFENILQCYAAYHSENPDDSFVDLTEFIGCESTENDYIQPSMGDRIASSIVSGAEALSGKVKEGASYATGAVERGSQKVTSKLSPATSKLTVSPYVKKGLEYTSEAAKATVKVKDWLVNWLRQVTIAVGEQLGPYFSKSTDGASKSTKEAISGAMKVVNAGVLGFSKIWIELERAGSSIARAVTTATVKNIEFKYGPDAGEAASLAMGVVVSIGETAFALENIGAKVVADMGASHLNGDFDYGEPMEFHEDHFDNPQTLSEGVDDKLPAATTEVRSMESIGPTSQENENSSQQIPVEGDSGDPQPQDMESTAGVEEVSDPLPRDTEANVRVAEANSVGDSTTNIQSTTTEGTSVGLPPAGGDLEHPRLLAIEPSLRVSQSPPAENNERSSHRMYPVLST